MLNYVGGWPFQEMFCKTEDPFYFTSSLPLLLYTTFWLYFLIASLCLYSIKELSWQDGYYETLVCHLLGQLVFWIKLIPCLTPCLSDSLACCVASRASLDLETIFFSFGKKFPKILETVSFVSHRFITIGHPSCEKFPLGAIRWNWSSFHIDWRSTSHTDQKTLTSGLKTKQNLPADGSLIPENNRQHKAQSGCFQVPLSLWP